MTDTPCMLITHGFGGNLIE